MKSSLVITAVLAALQNIVGGQAAKLVSTGRTSPRNLEPLANIYANGAGTTGGGGCSGDLVDSFTPGSGAPECVDFSPFSCIQAAGSNGDLTCTTLLVEAFFGSGCTDSAGIVGWENFALSGNDASIGTDGNNFGSFQAIACSTGDSPCDGNACGFDGFGGCGPVNSDQC